MTRHCPDPGSASDWMNFAFVLTAINLNVSIGRVKRTPRFLPSLPLPPTFIFLALVSFLARPKSRIPFLGLSLLRNQTETLAMQANAIASRHFEHELVNVQLDILAMQMGVEGGEGCQVVSLLPILHSVVFPSRAFYAKFCYGDQWQFSRTATRGQTTAKTRELRTILYYSLFCSHYRPFSTLKFTLGSKA